MPKPNVAVVVPIYRQKPSTFDDMSLRRLKEILGEYTTYWVAPDTLDVTEYARYSEGETLRFSPEYFRSPQTYSRLFLREDLYARFKAHDYALVHQTDAFVFQDSLEEFCGMGYHYFGAGFPHGFAWPSYSFRGVSHVVNRYPALKPKRKAFVGNGGLSLRHVEATRELLRKDWLASRTYRGQEDIYFATRIFTRWKDLYRICDLDTAYRFAFDEEPRQAYERIGRQLPLGAHAWPKVDPEFWKPIFADLGYPF